MEGLLKDILAAEVIVRLLLYVSALGRLYGGSKVHCGSGYSHCWFAQVFTKWIHPVVLRLCDKREYVIVAMTFPRTLIGEHDHHSSHNLPRVDTHIDQRRRLLQRQVPPLHIRRQSIDDIHGKPLDVHGIFRAQRLSGADVVHHAHLLLREILLHFLEYGFRVLRLGDGLPARVVADEALDLLQDGRSLVGPHAVPRVGTESDGLGKLGLRDTFADVGGALDD